MHHYNFNQTLTIYYEIYLSDPKFKRISRVAVYILILNLHFVLILMTPGKDFAYRKSQGSSISDVELLLDVHIKLRHHKDSSTPSVMKR